MGSYGTSTPIFGDILCGTHDCPRNLTGRSPCLFWIIHLNKSSRSCWKSEQGWRIYFSIFLILPSAAFLKMGSIWVVGLLFVKVEKSCSQCCFHFQNQSSRCSLPHLGWFIINFIQGDIRKSSAKLPWADKESVTEIGKEAQPCTSKMARWWEKATTPKKGSCVGRSDPSAHQWW